MSRHLRTLVMLVLLGSCAGSDFTPPRNLDDACDIVRERPKYLRAMKKTEERWGVAVPVQMAIIYQESKFDGDIRTPVQYVLGVIPMGRQSSAYGYAQALDGTWAEYQRARGGHGARRHDINAATDFMGWYMTQTLEETGLDLNDARGQYLAYHEGRAGYLRGTHNRKAWLLRIADSVAARAVVYDTQLRLCGKR